MDLDRSGPGVSKNIHGLPEKSERLKSYGGMKWKILGKYLVLDMDFTVTRCQSRAIFIAVIGFQ